MRTWRFVHQHIILAAMLAAFLLLAGIAAPVTAAPGDLDPAFGSGGVVTTDFGGTSVVHGIIIQADTKLVATGAAYDPASRVFRFALARYSPDGVLDESFGNGGTVTTAIGGGNAIGNTSLQQPDGRIVSGGRAFNGRDDDFALVRYNTNGSPDPTFGDGGVVVTPTGPGNDRIFLLDRYADGKLLALGLSSGTGGNALMMARYNANGSLDTTFANGGIAIDAGAPGPPIGFIIQANQGILVQTVAGQSIIVTRYSANGDRDATFGTDGSITTSINQVFDADHVNRIRPQRGGRVIVSGSAGGRFAVARYHGDGSLDATFGSGGLGTSAFASGEAFDLIVRADQKIVVAGTANDMFALARYDASRAQEAPAATAPVISVIPLDDPSRPQAAEIQQNLADLLARFSREYGLVADRPLRIYLARDEGIARARLSSDLGLSDAGVDGFFRSRNASQVGTVLGNEEQLIYLPNVLDLPATLAFFTAAYTINTIGGAEFGDVYPNWFYRGFEDYQRVRFSTSGLSFRNRATADTKEGTAPALSAIATNAGRDSFIGSDDAKLASYIARSWAAVDFIVRTYGEGALARLLQGNAFGSIAQFNALLQSVTGMTVNQLNSALEADLQR